MGDNLIFSALPEVTIATNRFVCDIPIRYKDMPMLEMVKELTAYTPKIPIFGPDGTKLAVVKGSQLYATHDGEKAGVQLRHLPGGTVCDIKGKLAFEIRRQGASALKMTAELFTFDGVFLRWSDEVMKGMMTLDGQQIEILPTHTVFQHCQFEGPVGIQIGKASLEMPACFAIPLPGE